MNLDDIGARLADELPSHRWSALIETEDGTISWRQGVLPFDESAVVALDQLTRPPATPSSSAEVGTQTVLVADEEVQVYVRCSKSQLFAVSATRPVNLGLMRSIVARSAPTT